MRITLLLFTTIAMTGCTCTEWYLATPHGRPDLLGLYACRDVLEGDVSWSPKLQERIERRGELLIRRSGIPNAEMCKVVPETSSGTERVVTMRIECPKQFDMSIATVGKYECGPSACYLTMPMPHSL